MLTSVPSARASWIEVLASMWKASLVVEEVVGWASWEVEEVVERKEERGLRGWAAVVVGGREVREVVESVEWRVEIEAVLRLGWEKTCWELVEELDEG